MAADRILDLALPGHWQYVTLPLPDAAVPYMYAGSGIFRCVGQFLATGERAHVFSPSHACTMPASMIWRLRALDCDAKTVTIAILAFALVPSRLSGGTPSRIGVIFADGSVAYTPAFYVKGLDPEDVSTMLNAVQDTTLPPGTATAQFTRRCEGIVGDAMAFSPKPEDEAAMRAALAA
jgi:hypothetical protein